MNKLVIFDLDGTIIDSIYDITDSINEMLLRYNYGRISYSDIKQFIGYGARNLVKDCIEFCGGHVTETELDERLDFYNNFYTNSNSPKTKIFSGLKEVLSLLKNRGYLLAVVTNKPQQTLNNINNIYLKEIGFEKVIGASKDVMKKPNPTTTLSLIKELNADLNETFFVGDGESDILTSLNARIKGIAVLWGYRSKEKLEKVGAKLFANSPNDLLDLIK